VVSLGLVRHQECGAPTLVVVQDLRLLLETMVLCRRRCSFDEKSPPEAKAGLELADNKGRSVVLELLHCLELILGRAQDGVIGIPHLVGAARWTCRRIGRRAGRTCRRCSRCAHGFIDPLELVEADHYVVLAHSEKAADARQWVMPWKGP